ncbi:hypothetical protein G7Y79_00002g005320 [Physcia stellaris]|nr:hypothetical protein G7Y79_00002g005320 [Physcia stellaris]
MEDSQSASTNLSSKRHSRNASYNRTASSTSEASNIPLPSTPFSPPKPQSRTPEPPLLPPSPPPKDFSYLQRPGIFHPLSNLVLNPFPASSPNANCSLKPGHPPPFRTPAHTPPLTPSTPLPTLLAAHAYRLAAISSATTLSTTPSGSLPPSQIFSLFYTRLASLVLLNLTPLAAQESKVLEDIHSPFYREPSTATGHNILPWELRVLVVRLQGVAGGDLKRSIVGYYELARDARREVVEAENAEEKQLWKDRLRECGIAVGNCLVEMGDLGGARRHFEGLRGRGEGRGNEDEVLDARLALISLKLGDVDAARRYLEATEGEDGKEIIRPLISMADGRYEDAVEEWRALRGGPHDTVAAQNLAVCLLYAGKLDETSSLLTALVDAGHSFHALTFNLATVYELSSERSRAKKMELAEKVAGSMIVDGKSEEGGGSVWAERGDADFKL